VTGDSVTVSVVIPHWGSRALTDAAIASLDRTESDIELIVVDNGTGDRFDADILIGNDENRGFAEACNQGVAVATHDLVVLLNNDCEVREGWLEPLLLAAQDEDVAAVGSLLLYPDGRVQHAGVRMEWDRGVLSGHHILEIGPRRDVEAVTAACVLIKKQPFWAVGGFDAGFKNGNEDVSLCLSLRDMCWRIVFEPASVVMHHESASGPERWTHVRENVRRLNVLWAHYKTGV
jgi:GT2 family glycosyltransferase